jgi:hypothetical protein
MRHGVKTCCRNENILRHFSGKSEAREKLYDNSIAEEIIKHRKEVMLTEYTTTGLMLV